MLYQVEGQIPDVQDGSLGAGLGSAGVGGYMTKNWTGAVGGFATGMIFTNIAMTMLGI